MDSPLARHLEALRRALRHDPLLARRVLEEAADHLAELVAAAKETGMTQHDAEQEAVRRFGPADELARGCERYAPPLRMLVTVAAVITVAVAGWLLMVSFAVLPTRDPAHVAMWRAVAVAYLAFAALTFAYLLAGARTRALRWAMRLAAALAVAAGGWLVARMVTAADGRFEGYLLLMGVLLAAHGLVAFADAGITAAIARRLRGA